MNPSRLHRLVLGALAALTVGLAPTPAGASGLDGPTGEEGLFVRLAPGSIGGGVLFDGDPLDVSVAVNLDPQLLGVDLEGGLRSRLVDGPKYALDLWAETGPAVWLRSPRQLGWNADLGLRNLFGRGPFRISLGGLFDLAFATGPGTSFRYRPAATGGLGWRFAGDDLWPDAVWMRGSLGYDFVPGTLGSVDGRVWLSIRWRLG